ncbi:MAG: TonB-dependent receptor [Novosphingobium sp.]
MNYSISALALAASLWAAPAAASTDETEGDNAPGREIVVTGQKPDETIENAPSARASIDADRIAATVNAASVEDTLKYLPSLVIRKRHIGDNFAPIATRTSGLGASARSLIYADGALLSALIANNNGNGSPRWTLVTPEEIERVDVLYGPFSAAYAGNSIGTTVNITTRLPDKFEARASALVNVQDFTLYGTKDNLTTSQLSGSVGDRFGPLALFASVTRTDAHSQPVSFTTIAGTADPAGTSGGYADLNKLGQPIRILGAGGIEDHVQTTYKAKAALDLGPEVRAMYVLGVWTDDTQATVQSYLHDGSGAVSYKTASSGATTGFNSAVYTRDALHFSHALSLAGASPRLDWQVIGTLYRFARDWQNNPSPDTASGSSATTGFVSSRSDLPGAFAGGPGTIQQQDGTGWVTLDAKAAIKPADGNILSLGAHFDRETLNARTFSVPNWLDGAAALGQQRSASHGSTRTAALWAQDELALSPQVSLTLGGRYEWWRAYDGSNSNYTAAINATIIQGERRFDGFSPKASLEWRGGHGLSLRLSAGQAWRMPTVGELYQTTTVGTLLTNPNPGLLPERARSVELALTKSDANGFVRISLFDEVIENALISQLNAATNTTFVQNVGRTRARGVELAVDRRDVVPGIDFSGSLTYADAITSKDAVFPAAVGKSLPSVPRWKGTAVLTWRPAPRLSLTAALRFASRNYANLANDDTVGNTYQGFYKYVVADVRVTYKVTPRLDLALGVDNLNNDKYFLFHPFPQRSFSAQIGWRY